MAQIILDSNNNLIQGDFDNATLNNRTKLQTTTTNATTNVYVVPNGSSTSAGVSVANNSSLTNASKIVMATNGSTDTQIISGVNGSGTYLPLNFYTNNSLSMTIDTANNVGIGTSSPGAKLETFRATGQTSGTYEIARYVAGSPSAAGTDFGGQINLGNNGGSYNSNAAVTWGIDAGQVNYGWLSFKTANAGTLTERMRIDYTGNVLVGKTSQITDELFGVDQTNTSRPAIIARAATTGSPSFKSVKVTNVNNSTQYHMTFAYNNGNNGNGAIVGNGDSQAAFASFSDSRLKKNIEDLPSQLDKINALRPVEFDYIKSGEHQIGFIAQEVKEVYPDLVAEGEDTMLTVTGLGKTEARLIKAIQEQQTIINELKTRIEALESK